MPRVDTSIVSTIKHHRPIFEADQRVPWSSISTRGVGKQWRGKRLDYVRDRCGRIRWRRTLYGSLSSGEGNGMQSMNEWVLAPGTQKIIIGGSEAEKASRGPAKSKQTFKSGIGFRGRKAWEVYTNWKSWRREEIKQNVCSQVLKGLVPILMGFALSFSEKMEPTTDNLWEEKAVFEAFSTKIPNHLLKFRAFRSQVIVLQWNHYHYLVTQARCHSVISPVQQLFQFPFVSSRPYQWDLPAWHISDQTHSFARSTAQCFWLEAPIIDRSETERESLCGQVMPMFTFGSTQFEFMWYISVEGLQSIMTLLGRVIRILIRSGYGFERHLTVWKTSIIWTSGLL